MITFEKAKTSPFACSFGVEMYQIAWFSSKFGVARRGERERERRGKDRRKRGRHLSPRLVGEKKPEIEKKKQF
jgi:hypothetical protein